MRKKLIELLCEVACNGPGESLGSCPDRKYGLCGEVANMSYCVIQNLANHLIVNGVTVQQWIPVAERLPEDDLPKDSKAKQIKVLVAYFRNGNWVVRSNMRVKGKWYDEPDRWSWSVSNPITHWMYLPQPPKEG